MRRALLVIVSLPMLAVPLAAQNELTSTLSLPQARDYALRHHPSIQSATATARAAGSVTREARAAKLPALSANVTGVEADHSTVLSAGALQTSSLYSRIASGIAVTQLVTDFGRTSNLVESAELRAQAQDRNTDAVRQVVLLRVTQAYYRTLAATAVLQAARAAVNTRQVLVRQVRALADSALRSTLDVRFAEVTLSQGQLELERAENLAGEAQADLSAALGLDTARVFVLADETAIPDPGDNADIRIQQALRQRPELLALLRNREAAHRFAESERRLNLPTIALVGAAGAVPAGDPRLSNTYSAAGVNVSIPILNGGLFSARREEAGFRATAADHDVRDLSIRIAREVRVAWLEANTALRRMAVTTRLVDQSNEALRLAQSRYDLGLGSIVELSQAQFNQTSAQIENASARYEYLSRRSALDYATGDLK